MQALADAVILSSGWNRRLIAFLAGAFGALALAPLNLGPAMVVPMTVAVWLIDGSSERASRGIWPGAGSLRLAFGAGWWLGFGYFLAGFWWLSAAFLIDPEFTWALPLGVLGVPAVLALFTGTGFVAARLLWVPGAPRVLALALGLGAAEWARGHLFTGFPWNSFGMALGGMLVTAQFAAVAGLDGLNFVAIALFAAPATLGDAPRARWRPVVAAAAAGLALTGYGALRLARTPPRTVPNVVVRIMQPGLRPDEKFSIENRDEIVSRYIDLSKRDDPEKGVRLEDVTMLVWPESAFPFILSRDPDELGRIGRMLPPKTTLVTGAARQEDVPATATSPAHSVYYNAIDVIASGGTVLGSYDKVHLVPFGEYLPFDALLRSLGLRNFVSIPGGFDPGWVRHALDVPGMPAMSPLICYEAIFPGEVMPIGAGGARPRALLNVTNDGWFGLTSGPAQHFAQSRLRTIEEGLPMIRGAATGISAILDPYGRVVAALPLGAVGIIDASLPEPVSPPPAPQFGRLLVGLVCTATLLFLLGFRLTGRRRP